MRSTYRRLLSAPWPLHRFSRCSLWHHLSLLRRPPTDMDYLRTLGSAAVSSLVQKSGLNLPFSLGPKVASFENRTIWSLYDATKKVRPSSHRVVFI